jgi:hypothetical protein
MTEQYPDPKELQEIVEIARIAEQKAKEMSDLATLLAEKYRRKAKPQKTSTGHLS